VTKPISVTRNFQPYRSGFNLEKPLTSFVSRSDADGRLPAEALPVDAGHE
jgi:23S rRNA C2498 (ribose-2'-O)-methylase RlmM